MPVLAPVERWHLHELDPGWTPPTKIERTSAYDKIETKLSSLTGIVARLAHALMQHGRALTAEIDQLTAEITALMQRLAPPMLTICGCGPLTAAKILAETAGIERFRSKDAYARHTATAPLPVWSSNRTRHRLSRTGNRHLNAAPHQIAHTQAHWHPDARAMIARRKANGNGGLEALRILKRRLSRSSTEP
ncbi:IS110 family transposase [Sciscionella marina]|uniref:IS110 family transposase n=1 Tax=Sciscionella marina TaxID=508770 RepID=UPI00037B3E3B|nr:IS110 family transposase [Sciscionella marina]